MLLSADPIVESVRALLLQRSIAGQLKYGTDMTRNDLALRDWLQQQLEELLDSAVYCQRAIAEIDAETDDER